MNKITLREARKNSGYSLKYVAKKLGISSQTLRNWENAKSFPSMPQTIYIEMLYGVRYDQITFLPSDNALSEQREDDNDATSTL